MSEYTYDKAAVISALAANIRAIVAGEGEACVARQLADSGIIRLPGVIAWTDGDTLVVQTFEESAPHVRQRAELEFRSYAAAAQQVLAFVAGSLPVSPELTKIAAFWDALTGHQKFWIRDRGLSLEQAIEEFAEELGFNSRIGDEYSLFL